MIVIENINVNIEKPKQRTIIQLFSKKKTLLRNSTKFPLVNNTCRKIIKKLQTAKDKTKQKIFTSKHSILSSIYPHGIDG